MALVGIAVIAATEHWNAIGQACMAATLSLLTGLRLSGPRGSVTLMGGGEIRWEHRELGDPAASKRDDVNGGFVIGGDVDLGLAKRWHALALGNYAGAARYAYARGALRYKATNLDWQGPSTVFAGAEGMGQGNDESNAFQSGGFVEISLVRQHLSVGLHGGYKDSWTPGESHRRGAYVGVSAYRAF